MATCIICRKTFEGKASHLCPYCPPSSCTVDFIVGQPVQHMTGDDLRAELRLMRKTIRLIAGMAGNPDPAQACRHIIAACKHVMPNDQAQLRA